MKVSKEQREEYRLKLLNAAERGFRAKGYSGLGIDGLAKLAGLTSGAFYSYFSSKKEAFKSVIQKGLDDYAVTVTSLQKDFNEDWQQVFLDFYLGEEHVFDLEKSCVVPGLSSEVVKSSDDIKYVFENGLMKVVEQLSQSNSKKECDHSLALMALLAGSVILSRSVSNPKTAKNISKASRRWADILMKSSPSK